MSSALVPFVKVTGYIPSKIYFRRKIYYVNKEVQSRKIRGAAIIVSNHTAVLDFGLYLFLFGGRTIHPLVGEVLYKKNKMFTFFLNNMGCIKVNRDIYDFSFMTEALDKLFKGKVVMVFPEARIPTKEETDLLEFKPSFVSLALESGAPIIPTYTDGLYGKKGPASVIIGESINLHELYDNDLDEKENIEFLCNYVRDYIKGLGDKLHGIKEEKKQKSK